MVKAGLQMIEAIDGIQKSTASKGLQRTLAVVKDDLDRGLVLSHAFSRHPEVFSDFYVNMVRVGEGTGRLQEAFQTLYEQIEFDREMRQRMKKTTRYPMFVIIAVAIAITILTIFVIPAFSKTYAAMKVELPLLTRLLLGTSDFAVNYWWAVMLGFGAIVYLWLQLLANPEGRYWWDKWKLRIPIIGKVLTKATIARFARTFGAAMRAGVPIVTAFQLVSRVVENAFFEDRILQMQKSVERGEVLSRVMRTAGIFSPLELQLITVGERTGEVENAIEEVAQLYTQEVEYEVDRLAQNIEPILLAFMGGLVLILILGVFLPLWDLGQAALHRK
jgi:MSHA biogenesis protein MshG